MLCCIVVYDEYTHRNIEIYICNNENISSTLKLKFITNRRVSRGRMRVPAPPPHQHITMCVTL